LDVVGPAIAEVIVAPRGLEVPVGGPSIYDPLERSPIDPRAVVLAVGVPPDGEPGTSLLEDAASGKASAVALKLAGRSCDLAPQAEAAGLALVAIPDEMSWSQLHAVLLDAVASWVDPDRMPGMGSVPLGDLFSLANAIAAMVGGAVTIEDPRARVLAYSNVKGQIIDEPRRRTILGRQVPDIPGVHAAYRRLWASDAVIAVDEIEGLEIQPRLAVQVRVGDEPLGSIWVMRSDDLAPDAEDALTEAARISAVHLIHARSARDIDRSVRGDLIRGLLEGRGSAGSAASQMGIERGSVVDALAVELPAGHDPDDAEDALRRERLVDVVALYCEAFRRRAACVAIGSTVYALLPAPAAMRREGVMALARGIQQHAESTMRVPLLVAVGDPVTDLDDLPRTRRELDRVLAVLRAGEHSSSLASIEEVHDQVVLLELRELAEDRPEIVQGKLERVLAHDASKGTAYAATLGAFLDAFGDVGKAADGMMVHPNTFRYRLRRLITLFDLDLDDPDERLVLGLQLRLLRDETRA
jgi:hypothetical protein